MLGNSTTSPSFQVRDFARQFIASVALDTINTLLAEELMVLATKALDSSNRSSASLRNHSSVLNSHLFWSAR